MDCFSRSHRVWHVGKPGLTSQDNKVTGIRTGRGWSERINYVLQKEKELRWPRRQVREGENSGGHPER